jgi:hypothetical protein
VKAKKEPEEPVKKVETAPAPAPTPSPAQLIQAEYQQLVLVSIISLPVFRIHDIWVWIRILLFLSLTFKMPAKKLIF